MTSGEGTIRILNPGWNNMKGNPYWSSPLTSIDSIEFRESNEEFTHDDMYYSWEDNGINFMYMKFGILKTAHIQILVMVS